MKMFGYLIPFRMKKYFAGSVSDREGGGGAKRWPDDRRQPYRFYISWCSQTRFWIYYWPASYQNIAVKLSEFLIKCGTSLVEIIPLQKVSGYFKLLSSVTPVFHDWHPVGILNLFTFTFSEEKLISVHPILI